MTTQTLINECCLLFYEANLRLFQLVILKTHRHTWQGNKMLYFCI